MDLVLSQQAPAHSGQRFDLADFVDTRDLRRMGFRGDAADTAMFLRQLTYIFQQTYDIKYPELKARSLIPVDNRVGPGAESYLWRQYDKKGTAKIVQNYADDFPNVEISGREFQTRIYSVGASYQYTMQDLRAASMAGLPLESRKAETARRVMENFLESVACLGLNNGAALGQDLSIPHLSGDALPMYGLANAPNIIQGGSSGYTTVDWTASTTTVQSILADVTALQKTIFDTSLGVHAPNTLVLPTAIYSKLASTPRSPTFTDDTMLQYILKASPWLQSIEYWVPLDSAGKKQDTTTVGGRILCYEKSPENMQLIVPQEFEQLPPQMLGMAFKIPCHMRVGGVSVRYPKSIAYLDGAAG